MMFTLGTYNLRMEHLDTGRDNRWEVRKPRLMESLHRAGFDVAGLQEVNLRMQRELAEEMGDEYSFWFFSPYSQSGVGDKAHGIMFRKSLFDILERRFFWVSDTPDVCSLADVGSSGNYRRGGCCAVFLHRSSGVRFFLMCTHACYNKKPNAGFAKLYPEMEARFNKENLPSFFVGDMNTTPETPASVSFREYWSDAYDLAPSRKGTIGTYNGYKYPYGGERIDFIYFRGEGVRVGSYFCDNALYSGKFASDHYPVTCTIII